MKKKFLQSALLTCLTLATVSLVAQTRNLDNFTKLRVAGSITVNLVPGNSPKADIDMVKGNYDDLITEVKNGTLQIKFKNKKTFWGGNNSKAKIELTYSDLESIDVAAGSSVEGKSEIQAEDMEIDVSSGASCSLNLFAKEIETDVSSGATLRLVGEADELDIDVSSGATFDGKGLKCKSVDVDASSGATARVWATEKIVGDASSGASIRYKGNPSSKNLDPGKYSGGSIREM